MGVTTFAQDKLAYQLFDKNGKRVKYAKMIKMLENAEVVLFGELHNNPIAHWLQLEVTQDLHKVHETELVLGAEMFERDNQLIINEYIADAIANRNFEEEVRLWNNYKTDYKPLLEFAKAHQLLFIATNIPRRYASMVAKKGLESLEKLPKTSKIYIAPLPIPLDLELPGYKAMLGMMGNHGGAMASNFPKAQAIKDATMAHSIIQNRKANQHFIHYNGAYHSDNFEGIGWYIRQYEPKTKVQTITTVAQKEVDKLVDEHIGKADFILCVPENMTTTY